MENKSTADFLLNFHQVQKGKWWGTIQLAGLFPELTLQELVFLCCKYYSIFLDRYMRPRVCWGFLYSFELFRFAEGMGISLGMSLFNYA
jgi:hypothetical protein